MSSKKKWIAPILVILWWLFFLVFILNELYFVVIDVDVFQSTIPEGFGKKRFSF
jgi:hypothetical protein